MLSDLEIAQKAEINHIKDIAAKLNISEDDLEFYGKYKAKVTPEAINFDNKDGKVILVTAISPTPAGEGKSTTTIGLADALSKLGKKYLHSSKFSNCYLFLGTSIYFITYIIFL